MSAYATIADMLARWSEMDLVQLAEADDLAGATPRITTQLTSAGHIIDGYVAVKYRTGAAPIPPLLTDIACDIARFRLFRDHPTDAAEKAHHAAMAQLAHIAKGTIKLDDGAEPLAERPGAILVERPERLFGRGSMGGF